MGRSKRTNNPLLCEQKELSIVAKSFFHTQLRALERKCKQIRLPLTLCLPFLISRNLFGGGFSELILFDEISDFTQFLIYITIDRMVALSTPSSGGRSALRNIFSMEKKIRT